MSEQLPGGMPNKPDKEKDFERLRRNILELAERISRRGIEYRRGKGLVGQRQMLEEALSRNEISNELYKKQLERIQREEKKYSPNMLEGRKVELEIEQENFIHSFTIYLDYYIYETDSGPMPLLEVQQFQPLDSDGAQFLVHWKFLFDESVVKWAGEMDSEGELKGGNQVVKEEDLEKLLTMLKSADQNSASQ